MRTPLLPVALAALAMISAPARAQTPAAAPDATPADASVKTVEGFLRREPVLPPSLPDYELITLDVKKKIVFHIGNQTYIGDIPILVYVPVTRAGRAAAVDRLLAARSILIKAAASAQVTTADLAAIQDAIEQSISDLRADAPVKNLITK